MWILHNQFKELDDKYSVYFWLAAQPEEAAELRVEEVAEEGTIEDAVETMMEAGAAVCAPMEAALTPMARLLTGPWPEGVETVAGPNEEPWGAPSDTCTATMEEEEGRTDEDGTAETEEEKDECRLKSPSTLGCCWDRRRMYLRLMGLYIH